MIFSAFAAAFRFLTIIPMPIEPESSEKDVRNSPLFFPLVGAFQGLFLAFLTFLLLKIMSADITAALLLILYVLITGGFHQDGLSDTFDALSVPSSGDNERDRTKRLRVMKDSTIGPIGVIAIVLSLLLKYLLLKETLLAGHSGGVYFLLCLMPVFSKWAMVVALFQGKSARADGLGQMFLHYFGFRQIIRATLLFLATILIFVIMFWYFSNFGFQMSTTFYLVLSEVVSILLVCSILKRVFTARFGGLTGDNFGAIHEISEILFLTVALLYL